MEDFSSPIDSDLPFECNFCQFCGNDTSQDQAYCSSICELQDLQGSNELNPLPALTKSGGRSTASSSSVSSTPSSSANTSPSAALGDKLAIDELTAEVSAFELPSAMVYHAKQMSKPLHFDYGTGHPQIDSIEALVSEKQASPISPSLLPHLYSRRPSRPTSNNGIRTLPSSQAGSPQTPTDPVARMQRDSSQQSGPRRSSANLLSPLIRPLVSNKPTAKQVSASTSPRASTSALSPLFRGSTETLRSSSKVCGKPGCPSAHKQTPKFDTRRPSAPLLQARMSFSSFSMSAEEEDHDADTEAPLSSTTIRSSSRGRARSRHARQRTILATSTSTVVRGKRSESAHILGQGVCEQFQPDLHGKTRKRDSSASGMSAFELGDSAVRSSSSSSEEEDTVASLQNRGRSQVTAAASLQRGRSKKREDGAAYRRSRSRHREFELH